MKVSGLWIAGLIVLLFASAIFILLPMFQTIGPDYCRGALDFETGLYIPESWDAGSDVQIFPPRRVCTYEIPEGRVLRVTTEPGVDRYLAVLVVVGCYVGCYFKTRRANTRGKTTPS